MAEGARRPCPEPEIGGLKDEGYFSIRQVEVKRLSSFPLRRRVTSFAGHASLREYAYAEGRGMKRRVGQ